MADFNIQVDDLVLYFTDSEGTQTYRLLSRQVYENPALELDVKPDWRGAVLNESGVDTGEIYYVTNLTRLRDPMTAAALSKELDDQPQSEIDVTPFAEHGGPALADLVVISNVEHAEDPKAYLIPRKLYEDDLPELPPDVIADIDFMVQEEGVLLANIRKFEHTGISCYLLNLTGLRSGQVPPRVSPPPQPVYAPTKGATRQKAKKAKKGAARPKR